MRILIVISGLTYGGAERQVVLLSKELVRMGHRVLIYTLNDDVPRQGELVGTDVELRVDQKRSKLDLAVIRRLRQCIEQWGADVVHGFLFDGDLYARFAAWGLRVPVLNSERNDGYNLRHMQRLCHWLTRPMVDGLVANSYAGAEVWRTRRRISAGRIHVVWNGIDLDEVDRRLTHSSAPARQIWPRPDALRVAVVGAIKPQKDHFLALQVAQELHRRDPRWRFVFTGDSLAGRSEHKTRVLAAHESTGAREYAVFTGVRTDVYELMASCDVLLVSSLFEGFPNVVLEAMACGVAVATTDYSDVRRILPYEWQVAADRRASTLADIVERCLSNRDAVIKAQRRWVEEHASLGRCAEAMLHVYGQYVGGARAGRALVAPRQQAPTSNP